MPFNGPMPKEAHRPSAATPEYLLPTPNAEDIAKLRASYFNRTGREIDEDQAREVLTRIMRFQYLNILINAPCLDTDFTPASPTTTGS